MELLRPGAMEENKRQRVEYCSVVEYIVEHQKAAKFQSSSSSSKGMGLDFIACSNQPPVAYTEYTICI